MVQKQQTNDWTVNDIRPTLSWAKSHFHEFILNLNGNYYYYLLFFFDSYRVWRVPYFILETIIRSKENCPLTTITALTQLVNNRINQKNENLNLISQPVMNLVFSFIFLICKKICIFESKLNLSFQYIAKRNVRFVLRTARRDCFVYKNLIIFYNSVVSWLNNNTI